MYIRRRTKRIMKSVLLVLIILAGLSFGGFYFFGNYGLENQISGFFGYKTDGNIEKVQEKKYFTIERNYVFNKDVLGLDEYREMKVLLSPGRIVLADNCTVIGVSVTIEKSQNIARSLNGEFSIRPTEHDVIEEVIDNFGIEVDYVTVDKIEDGVFYGSLVLHDDKRILKLDIRPSDAFAIGLRFDAPVYVHKELIEEMSQKIC